MQKPDYAQPLLAAAAIAEPGSRTSAPTLNPGRTIMFQRIGWQRPSLEERRWWVIQGAVILATVSAIGTLVFLALR